MMGGYHHRVVPVQYQAGVGKQGCPWARCTLEHGNGCLHSAQGAACEHTKAIVVLRDSGGGDGLGMMLLYW